MCANRWSSVLSSVLHDRCIAAHNWAFLVKSHVWMLADVWLGNKY